MRTFRVSQHSVDRYIDRINPRATATEARRAIQAAGEVASRLRQRTDAGHVLYQGGDPPLLLVVKFDGNGKAPVVATVLPWRQSRGMTAAELAILEEHGVSPELLREQAENAKRRALEERRQANVAANLPHRPPLPGTPVELTEHELDYAAAAIRSESTAIAHFIERESNTVKVWRVYLDRGPVLVRYSRTRGVFDAAVEAEDG